MIDNKEEESNRSPFKSTFENDNNPKRRAEDSVDITTPWGRLSAGGQNVILILIVVFCLGLIGYALKSHVENASTLASEIREVKYILLLSQEKRDRIADQLTMPDSIRRALRP